MKKKKSITAKMVQTHTCTHKIVSFFFLTFPSTVVKTQNLCTSRCPFIIIIETKWVLFLYAHILSHKLGLANHRRKGWKEKKERRECQGWIFWSFLPFLLADMMFFVVEKRYDYFNKIIPKPFQYKAISWCIQRVARKLNHFK